MTIRYLIQKEFLQMRRSAFLPRLIVLFPIMIMCVMPWVMNQEVKNIRVCVVDRELCTASNRAATSSSLVRSRRTARHLPTSHRAGATW